MDLSHHSRTFRVGLVAVHEELPGLVVEAGLGERDDEQTPDHREGVAQRDGLAPVLFQGVDADVPVRRHVRVVDLGQEEAAWRRLRIVLAEDELETERASFEGGLLWEAQGGGGGSRGGKTESDRRVRGSPDSPGAKALGLGTGATTDILPPLSNHPL